jgi:hypothetical protein
MAGIRLPLHPIVSGASGFPSTSSILGDAEWLEVLYWVVHTLADHQPRMHNVHPGVFLLSTARSSKTLITGPCSSVPRENPGWYG